MEDLFQIIFIAIFIISSIISSMNKKKKQKAAKQKIPKVVTQQNATKVQKKQKSSADIIEEMLGFKIEIPEPQPKEAPPIYAEENQYSSWDPSAEFEKVEKVKDSGKSNYEEKILAKKTDFEIAKNKHKAFKEIIKKPKPQKAKIIKGKLFADKSSLKDYILIQEILNKPKALRK